MSVLSIILTILTIIGSLGIFLFGMILMSESLQKVAGIRMRKVLSSITSNDFKGVLTGLSITGAIQSSSATTVMLVSFVNAGLISLRRSFSLIMGANIGTTVTAWIIVLLGFGQTFSITSIVLPLVALSLPFFFSGKNIHRSWAEFIIGFAILFLGLEFLKTNIPVVDQSSIFVQHFENLIHFGFLSVLLFVGIGIVLTIIFQSSSAVMALTFVIAVDGWIPYDMAAAMVLGENLGTTITANIAALVANRPAKRSAMFHVLFNFTGIIWALVFFNLLLKGIDALLINTIGHSAFVDSELIPLGLAIYHTAFNVINTLIFFSLLPVSERLLTKIIPRSRIGKREKYRLVHFGSSYLSTAELSIVQARKEIKVMADLVIKLFKLVPSLLVEWDAPQYERTYKRIKKYERITDKIEHEISDYLTKASESKLSNRGTTQVRNMLKIVDDMESIGDSCRKMALSIYLKNKEGLYFIQEIRNDLDHMFSLVQSALITMEENISKEKPDMAKALELEKSINDMRDNLKAKNIESIKDNKYSHKTGSVFTDIIHHCERIGDHAINVSESINQN